MATTTAKTKKDVDEMTARERLYDSLGYSYGKKGEQISQEYDKAKSQQSTEMQKRGMGRSSYALQTLANTDQRKIEALDDNQSQMIADYENRLQSLEQQEKADEQWERQFAENQRQYNENMAYQRERANVADTQWNQQFNYQQGRDETADKQWQMNYDANRADTAWNQNFQREQYDWNKEFQQQQYADSRADTAWNQAFQTKQYEDNRADAAWTQAFQQKQYEDSRADTAWQQEFQTQQWEAQQAQWREQFDYSKMSDDQKIAYNYIVQAAANGNDVSDDLLARAGLIREDYNAIKAQAKSSGGGGGPRSTTTTPTTQDTTTVPTDSSVNADVYGLANTPTVSAYTVLPTAPAAPGKITNADLVKTTKGGSPYSKEKQNSKFLSVRQ